MRVLLVSTYDLGRQPFGLASPAAWLRRAGVDVDCADASREAIADARLAGADGVAFYLPMHTATRLAGPLIARVRSVNPAARLCAYGLYAPLNAAWLESRGVSRVLGPEAEHDLVEWAAGRDTPAAVTAVPRLDFIPPDRAGLPPLPQYAALRMPDGSRRVIGATDATRGCRHLCRHCPIVPVYGGTFRVVPIDVVLADVGAQVRAGAQHITFGDPDFLNGPTHARRLVERLHAEFPALTYDVTVKIEHLLAHAGLLDRLRETGCLFVTSAVESLDDRVLALLRKGHTRDDFFRAVARCRASGLELNPTFIPFTPWTTPAAYADLLRVLAELDLVDRVAPVQLAIRLLITSHSPLLELPDVQACVGAYDAGSLAWRWAHPDPDVDALQSRVMHVVQRGTALPRATVFATIAAEAGMPVPPAPAVEARIPVVTEPWYCCAEPMESV